MEKHIGYIENGINIDHIPQGNVWYIIKILKLDKSSSQVGIGLNLPSKKFGKKDLIKIENHSISQNEIDSISTFCMGSTLSVIKDFKVIEKKTLELPKKINNIIICPNIRCVSRLYKSQFNSSINHNHKIYVKCYYCEQSFLLNELSEYKLD